MCVYICVYIFIDINIYAHIYYIYVHIYYYMHVFITYIVVGQSRFTVHIENDMQVMIITIALSTQKNVTMQL